MATTTTAAATEVVNEKENIETETLQLNGSIEDCPAYSIVRKKVMAHER